MKFNLFNIFGLLLFFLTLTTLTAATSSLEDEANSLSLRNEFEEPGPTENPGDLEQRQHNIPGILSDILNPSLIASIQSSATASLASSAAPRLSSILNPISGHSSISLSHAPSSHSSTRNAVQSSTSTLTIMPSSTSGAARDALKAGLGGMIGVAALMVAVV